MDSNPIDFLSDLLKAHYPKIPKWSFLQCKNLVQHINMTIIEIGQRMEAV